MAFILDAQRQKDVVAAFKRYNDYIEGLRGKMPASAFALASSEWYFNFNDHHCPHDAWLERMCIEEPSSGERSEERYNSMRILLLAGYHDGFIEFYYPKVFRYRLDAFDSSQGHGDWRYDEFRLSEDGHVIHEIEWCGMDDTVRWVIEASDVECRWIPIAEGS